MYQLTRAMSGSRAVSVAVTVTVMSVLGAYFYYCLTRAVAADGVEEEEVERNQLGIRLGTSAEKKAGEKYNRDGRVLTIDQGKVPLGKRIMAKDADVYAHNSWDHADWTEENTKQALEKIEVQMEGRVSQEEVGLLEKDAGKNWDKFYNQHDNKFFKNRMWLLNEFPDLQQALFESNDFKIFEVGCGVGNTVIPLIKGNRNKNIHVYACDISPTAVQIMKGGEDYDSQRCTSFVYDLCSDDPVPHVMEGTIDIITMIFVLSAISKENFQKVMNKLAKLLKPGTGTILFRDYGRYDLAQLRFKKGRFLSDNFYKRGDGTRVYFFTKEEMEEMMNNAGLETVDNQYDRKLIVNRSTKQQMTRVWIHAKFKRTN